MIEARYLHTNLTVSDLERMIRFYRDVFGCVPVREPQSLQGGWLDAITGIEGAMDEAIADDAPAAAMLFATHALQAFRTDVKSLMLLLGDVQKELAEVDLRLWRRAFVKSSAYDRKWDGTDVVKYDEEAVLAAFDEPDTTSLY